MVSDTPTTAPDELSLHEMLRIMDVARSLREEQETVQREFSREETIAAIRERLLASSEVTGDTVTPEEVDAAIDLYFGNLYKFRAPRPGLQTALAHVWVMRRQILTSLLAFGTLAVVIWWLFFATSGPFSSSGRTQRALADHQRAIQTSSQSIRALSKEPETIAEVERLQHEADAALQSSEVNRVGEIRSRLQSLDARLQEEYEVHIVAGADRRSGIDRYFTDTDGSRVSGYYVIVEARSPDGRILERRIHNSETGRDERVSEWGERVPEEIYEQVKRDKQADGIVNDTLFAVKRRGEPAESVVMKNPFGKVVERLGQITKW